MNFKTLNTEIVSFMEEYGISDTIKDDTQTLNEYKKWRRPKGYNKNNDNQNKSPLDDLIDKENGEESEVIEGEIVDELPDNLKSANSEETKKAYENQYALVQVYQGAIDEIANNNQGQEVSEKSKQEVSALLREWLVAIDKQKEQDSKQLPTEDKDKYDVFVKQAQDSVEKLAEEVEDTQETDNKGRPKKGRGKKLLINDLRKIMKDGFLVFRHLSRAKLPKSLLQAIAYTNPLTALIYDNTDIARSGVKASVSAAKTAIGATKTGLGLAKDAVVGTSKIVGTVGKGTINGVKNTAKLVNRIRNANTNRKGAK